MTQLPRPLLLYLVGRQADEARAVSRFDILPGQNLSRSLHPFRLLERPTSVLVLSLAQYPRRQSHSNSQTVQSELMFAVRLVNRRRNRLRPIAAFTFPCCGPATGLIRAYSDGGPVIATGDPKTWGGTDESIAEGPTTGKKPRKGRSDAGKSRPVKKDGSPRKPRTPSTKPRKKRSDAGVPKGLSKKVYEEVLHGARPVIATGGPETGGEQPQTDESITKPHEGSDAGVSRVVKNNEDAPKPRTPSTKPRKRRSDAGILKGPLKKVFEDVLHGARAAIPEGEAETDSGK